MAASLKPLLQPAYSSTDDDGHPSRNGTLWSFVAHIITAVIGSGVLSLTWSTGQLGWILGPISLLCFAVVTYVSAFLLSDCYRSPDPVNGLRNYSYMHAVRVNLGRKQTWFCGLLQYMILCGNCIAYVITTSTSMRAIERSNCYHRGGHEAFGNTTPGNLLTGFGLYEPYWLIDLANACIILHLVGGYQVYCQPIFAFVEDWFRKKFPDNIFMNNFSFKLPLFHHPFQVNLLRICFRSLFVASTIAVAMAFPYFNQILGVLGAFNFWPLVIYFPVEMYFVQKKIRGWTRKWIVLRTFSLVCLLVSIICLISSIQGLLSAKFGLDY